MKAFATTKRDNDRGVMRLELDGTDIELLGMTIERLERLLKVEEALDVVAVQSPTMFGTDLPTATADGAKLLNAIVDGWHGEETTVYEVSE